MRFSVWLCALTILTFASGEPLLQFSAKSSSKTSLGAGPLSVSTVEEGQFYFDGPNTRQRMELTKIGIDSGTPGLSFDRKVEGELVQLLLFNVGKNFTWSKLPGQKTECICSKLTTPFQPLYQTPDAVEGDVETIQIDGKDVQTKKYTEKISLGGVMSDNSFFMDVAEPNKLRRLSFKLSAGSGGGSGGSTGGGAVSVGISSALDFWDIQSGVPADKWSPDSSCECPKDAPAKIDVVTYPEPVVGAPVTCSAPTGCSCIKNTNDGLSICKDLVSWPIQQSVFAETQDQFIKTVYDISPFSSQTGECADSYKKFLCQFYFSQCFEGGIIKKPPQFLNEKCTAASVDKAAKSADSPNSVYELPTLTEETSGNGSSALTPSLIVVFALAIAFCG